MEHAFLQYYCGSRFYKGLHPDNAMCMANNLLLQAFSRRSFKIVYKCAITSFFPLLIARSWAVYPTYGLPSTQPKFYQ